MEEVNFQYRWVMILSDETKVEFYTSRDRVNNPLTTIPGINHSPVHYFLGAAFDRIGPKNGKIPPGLEHHPLASPFTKNGIPGWLVKKSDVVESFAVRVIP